MYPVCFQTVSPRASIDAEEEKEKKKKSRQWVEDLDGKLVIYADRVCGRDVACGFIYTYSPFILLHLLLLLLRASSLYP